MEDGKVEKYKDGEKMGGREIFYSIRVILEVYFS